jgi:hypothetical protein
MGVTLSYTRIDFQRWGLLLFSVMLMSLIIFIGT